MLDPKALANLQTLEEAEPGLVGEVIAAFLRSSACRLAELRRAAASGDAARLVKPAHALKGGCGLVGAEALAALCAQIEDRGRAGSLARVPELIESLQAKYAEVRQLLEDHQAGRSRG